MGRTLRVLIGFFGAMSVLVAVPSYSEQDHLQDALRLLRQSAAGREIVDQASQRWDLVPGEGPEKLFRWGEVSRTDAVLTRHLDPKTGEERKSRQVMVYLRKNQPVGDLVLDIAHELTHALNQPSWDPYDPDLTPFQYLQSTLEGQGGEVAALIAECRVALELAFEHGGSAARCQRYRAGKTNQVSQRKVRADFYRVGRWEAEIYQRLGKDAFRFPLLSSKPPELFSSTGRAPYPISLLKEFEALNQSACENSRRRLEALSGRSPAEAGPQRDRTLNFIRKRCGTPSK